MISSVSSKSRSRNESASQVSDWSGTMKVLSNTNAKQQSSGFRLFGKQSLPNLSIKATASENSDFLSPMIGLDELRGIVQPCPFVRPLEHKLQAREEPSTFRRPELKPNYEQGISAITIARRRGETMKKLNGRASDEDLAEIQEEGIQSNGFFEELARSSKYTTIVKVEEIEQVALKVAPEPALASMWSYYITCYAKGQFNILTPPDPPAWGTGYEYLPAVKPPNEDQRMALSREYDLLWPVWTKERSGALLRAAMAKFDTPFASFSFFDESNELFRAENGFNQPEIEREMSISAHVLYTNEVMVLLDTHKDWRFARNPLVKGIPCIRFFAGAPLLSAEGLVMGVFAVWSKEPRTSFNPEERRELAEFSALLMTDLTLQVTRISDPDLFAITRLEEEGQAIQLPRSQSPEVSLIDLDAATNFESDLIPSGLRYHRSISPPLSTLYTCGPVQQDNHLLIHTPPPSREKEAIDLESHGGTGYFLEPNVSLHGMALLPTLQDIQESNTRPFSSSDLTSLHPLPPNTPDRSLMDEELSHHPSFDFDQFPSIQDVSEFEDSHDFSTSSDILPTSKKLSAEILDTTAVFPGSTATRNTEHIPGRSERSSEDSSSIHVLRPVIRQKPSGIHSQVASPTQDVDELVPAARSGHLQDSKSSTAFSDTSSNFCDGISPSWESSEAAKDAAMTCSNFAQKMGYDLIYVAEIRPAQPGMTDEALLKPGGMTKRILVAYGLTQPLDLSSETHLRILRCRGSEHWSNTGGSDSERHYTHGCLVSILADTSIPRKLRDSGLVMGVFSWSRPIEKDLSTNEEVRKLLEFSQDLKDLLLKKPERKLVKRSMTEPTSPTMNPYPANEATELQLDEEHRRVAKYSLDSRQNRRYM